jgi:hypothetical protein
MLAAAYGLALRGRCPLARFACLPHVRHVAGVHGGRASPYFMPPTTKRWSLRSASRVRLRPKCSPVRCSPRWGCAPRAASAFALDTALRSKLFERKGGQVNRGIPQPHRGEDMPRKSLDALGVTTRLGMGAGRAKRSAAATCTPATWRTDKPPWGGASVGGCNE